MNSAIRVCVTLLVSSCAVLAGSWTWKHYQLSPWTRDGRVRADVVVVAPDVAGWVTRLDVRDNQVVNKGDLLFEIDPVRYRSLLNESKARMEHSKHAWELAALLESRRVPLARINAISAEDLDNAHSQVLLAKSQYEVNKAQWETARINLARTSVVAPANGMITNVRLQEGNYVAQGAPAFSLIKNDSFYVTAYFEETKLLDIREGIWPRCRSCPEGLRLVAASKASPEASPIPTHKQIQCCCLKYSRHSTGCDWRNAYRST